MGLSCFFTIRCSQFAKGCLVLQGSGFLLRVFARTSKDHSSLLQRSSAAWGIFTTWSSISIPFSVPVLHAVSPCTSFEGGNSNKPLHQLQVNRLRKIKQLICSILWRIWDSGLTVLRVIQLFCTFLPVLLLFPLSLISCRLRSIWYSIFLFGIEFSGPIYVKLGQWASTRRDIFPEEFCSHLTRLQRTIRPHSWYYTEKTLEKAFGPKWKQIFVRFDTTSIGSGCCAQVYKAWINEEKLNTVVAVDVATFDNSENSCIVEGLELFGMGHLLSLWRKNEIECGDSSGVDGLSPVAVKVLHPRIETLLRRDLFILKTVADVVTWLIPSLRWLSLDECVEDFSHLMKSQVNFCEEAHNLDVFSSNFKDDTHVIFPRPYWPLTTPYLLVETYEEGEHVQNFVISYEDDPIKKELADVGLNTLLKMVFVDNFTHGDLHPGNMLVRRLSPPEAAPQKKRRITKCGQLMSPKFKLVILDCGIVSTLDERGRKCLKDVFSAVVDGNGERVADLFLAHSNHQCDEVESFRISMRDIVDSALKKTVTLKQVEVSQLMTELFSSMIRHRVKLDGSFSSVILAIVVLEGLGRSLDSTVDIVEKAKPFLINSM